MEKIEKDKILIVEDDPDTSFILDRALTKNNYEVKTAIDGYDALELLKTFFPKVIIADWTMPKMDGIQLCSILKNDDKYKSIYYIILTARSSSKDKIKGLDVGADDFLVKPIENQELLARIRSGVRIYNLQDELKNIEHNKAVIELAATIGHQINNPLSSLIVTVNALKKELEEHSHSIKKEKVQLYQEEFLIIDESIKRIEKFVDALMKIKDPEIIKYVSSQSMIKFD